MASQTSQGFSPAAGASNNTSLETRLDTLHTDEVNTKTSVNTVKASVDAAKVSTDSVKTSVDAVKTEVDAVKTSTDAVKASTDTVKTSTDAVKTSVDAVKTSLGSDVTTPFAMPAGGSGVRGWLSAIWTKLNDSLAVTIASLPLPAGAATDASLTTLLGRTPSTGQKTKSGSTPVVIASDQVVPVSQLVSTVQQTAVSITTAATSQTLLAADANRKYLLIQNPSDTDMYINLAGAAASASAGLLLGKGGGSYETPPHFCPTGALTVFCSASGKNLVVITN